MRVLQFRRMPTTYECILLVNADTQVVLGEWSLTGRIREAYLDDRNDLHAVSLWSENTPYYTQACDYGELISESKY